jgi:Family of unknown function (DUF5719)
VTRRMTAFAAVLAMLVAIYGATQLAGPAAVAPAATVSHPAAVTSLTRVCPPAAPGSGQAHVAVTSVPSAGASGGTVTLSPLAAAGAAAGGKAAAPVTVSSPGQASLVTAPSSASATAVVASGAMAEGLAAEQASGSGLSTLRCADPAPDLWFTGTGQAAGGTDIRLYLMNTDSLAASVSVTIMTDSGTVDANGETGITVAPGRTVEQSLTSIVHGSEVIGLNVHSSVGRVAAAVWESGTWLPETTAPSTSSVIPGLSAASSAARLFIVVPGSVNAQVKVVALTPQGRFQPFGAAPVSAPAGAASEFTLSSLGVGAAAIELTSNVPIAAAVLVPGAGLGAVTAAVPPLAAQGVVAGNPVSGRGATGVLLSAPSGQARVSISTVPAGTSSTVTVPAGHTVASTIKAPRGRRGSYSIVVTPLAGSGPVYAARVVTNSSGLTGQVASILPVASAPTSIELPPVRGSYTAVQP